METKKRLLTIPQSKVQRSGSKDHLAMGITLAVCMAVILGCGSLKETRPRIEQDSTSSPQPIPADTPQTTAENAANQTKPPTENAAAIPETSTNPSENSNQTTQTSTSDAESIIAENDTEQHMNKELLSPQVSSDCFDCNESSHDETVNLEAQLSTQTYNNLSFQAWIKKPRSKESDVFVLFHGTVQGDDQIVSAAKKTLDSAEAVFGSDHLYVSVAYSQSGDIGDNIPQAEAAVLWVQNKAEKDLDHQMKRVFLLGHSQGGYIVTRLNTMLVTDGVIANAPGPLDFKLRCELEEQGKYDPSRYCRSLNTQFGSTNSAPQAYVEKSLLTYIEGFKSKILFTQGLTDDEIQLTSWPTLKQKATECTSCAEASFLEIPGLGHPALFQSKSAAQTARTFLGL